jgi:plastocyanin
MACPGNPAGRTPKKEEILMRSQIHAVTAAAALFAAPAIAQTTWDVSLSGMNFVFDGQNNTDISLIINTGDTVRWTWLSGFHNVVSGDPGAPDAGDLFSSGPPTGAAGTIFEHTFLDLGEFAYHCEIHGSGGMISSVTVVPAPTTAALALPLALAAASRRRR